MRFITGVIAFFLTLGLPAFWFGYYYNTYSYEKNIGSYIENAYEVNTPSRMIAEIKKAIEGMKKEGLTEDMYGAMWFKKPDNKMSWQYDFLNSVIERAEAVEKWQENMDKTGSVETLGDVYEQKMDNLREFLKENGRADWIAKDVWLVNNHPFYYFIFLVSLIWILLTVILWTAIGVFD